VQGGKIYGTLEARDDLILSHLASFDELAYRFGFGNERRALFGHGMGENSALTGTAFFVPLLKQRGAASSLLINPLLEKRHESQLLRPQMMAMAAALEAAMARKPLPWPGSNRQRCLSGGSADFNEFLSELSLQK